MKPLILIVEDNSDLLFNLNLILETNNFQTITAKNGKQALKILSETDKIPDIILSDIMMPEMDGYDFFKNVSTNPRLNRIPFIFLTARTSPKEIRLGKLLGVDDYITKPFNEKDLLAIILGKIARVKRINMISEKVENLFSIIKREIKSPILTELNELSCLLLAYWDDKYGPRLSEYHPKEKNFQIPMDDIANQLFMAATSIYGHGKITKAEGILLNIKNLNTYGYLYFDSYPDQKERYGEKQFMLAFLAPMISYLDSLKLKEIFEIISHKIKQNREWDIKQYWRDIFHILSSSSIKIQQN
ncbi:MAG: PleD family two-component system response regulator [Promethearchaeota archaeon]